MSFSIVGQCRSQIALCVSATEHISDICSLLDKRQKFNQRQHVKTLVLSMARLSHSIDRCGARCAVPILSRRRGFSVAHYLSNQPSCPIRSLYRPQLFYTLDCVLNDLFPPHRWMDLYQVFPARLCVCVYLLELGSRHRTA